MTHWAQSARFYHIYPLGCCDAPERLYGSTPAPRLEQLQAWVEHLVGLGVNAVWLGPLMLSSSHGYDTVDYYHLDARLGDDRTLRSLVDALHGRGIRVVLDAVFNHVGREFWAFRDLQRHLRGSRYANWFQRLDFSRRGRAGDPFSYQTWKGHHSLVKLKLSNPEVREHLLGALRHWIEAYDIDGLRLDAADCLSLDFMRRLGTRARRLKPDFWLLGEVVHGDYRKWIHKGGLDAVTNYELYDALHKSQSQGDYTHLAHSLQRQFGPHGVYRGLPLYNFLDNHDVTRINSRLRSPALLYPLHLLLYTLPGIPSLYYGSEWGMHGRKQGWSDAPLRPAVAHPYTYQPKPAPDLMTTISRLAALHAQSEALQHGGWHLLQASRKTIAYTRISAHEALVVAINGGGRRAGLSLNLPWHHGELLDLLSGERFAIHDSQVHLAPLHPYWGRILKKVA